jgi:autotransporter-associated beta strand protein
MKTGMRRRLSFFFLMLVCARDLSAQTIPAFPGAEGFGALATGGRGGDVYIVTNTAASGAGSLAEGLATVPAAGRTIVFAVSGHIHINGLRLASSKVTIAGQTAPGDGVGLVDGTFRISGDDVVVRHLRMRHRKSGSGGDCLNLDSGSLNCIIDHCSMQFSTDENMSSFSSPPENLTMQWSLNGWGLETHSAGGLWDQNHATCHHSLWAHNHTRNPKARPGQLDWVNNVTFDWDIGFIMGDSETPADWRANVRRCYFLCPPGNLRTRALEKANIDRNGGRNFSLFMEGNVHDADGDGLLNGTDKGYGIASGSYITAPTPFNAPGGVPVVLDSALVAFKKIASQAGALRMSIDPAHPIRDETDTVMITNLQTQRAMHVSNESQTGAANGGISVLGSAPSPLDGDRDGMPDFYETALGWNAGTPDHNTPLASAAGVITGVTYFQVGTAAGYTRLEEYLHFKASPHGNVPRAVAGTPTSATIDLRKFTVGFTKSPVFTVADVINGSAVQSGVGGAVVTFSPTINATGRARFNFTVTDADGSTWTQTCCLCISNTTLPRDLVWKGGFASNVWDTLRNNFLLNGNSAAFVNGDRLVFDDTGSRSPAVGIAANVTVGSLDVDTTGTYTFGGAGGIASLGPLVKRGTGTMALTNTGANSFSSIALEDGTLSLNSATAAGGGPISLYRGTLTLTTATGADMPNSIAVLGPATLNVSTQHNQDGVWSGNGSLTVNTTALWTLTGSTSGFAGTMNLGSGGSRVRIYGPSGSSAATWDLGTGTAQLMNRNGQAINLGALMGGPNTVLLGAQSVDALSTYTIGALNLSTTFAGSIRNGTVGASPTAIVKTGSGILTLAGASTYTGATTIAAGSLAVNGTLGNSPVTIASGAVLRGGGAIAGPVTMASGGQISPGAASGLAGTLSVGAGLTLQGGTLSMQLSGSATGANDRIQMAGGTLALTGVNTLQIALSDGFLDAGVYTLIDGGTATTGTIANLTTNLPTGGRQTFALSTPPGKVLLTVTGAPATLVWHGDVGTSWDVNASANWRALGVGSNFFNFDAVRFDDTASQATATVIGVVQPRAIIVDNAAIAHTITGAGTISGTGTFTKLGPGAVSIANAHTYSGGTTIQNGVVNLITDVAGNGAFGTGPVTAQGGVIRFRRDAASYNDNTIRLVVPTGSSTRVEADDRCDLYGSLSGGGTLDFWAPWVRTTIMADWSAFTGRINAITDADGGDFRLQSTAGLPTGHLDLGANVNAYFTGTVSAGVGTTISLGTLSGGSSSRLRGGATGGRNFTWRIGQRNENATFAGHILEENAETNTSVAKVGGGTWVLAGTNTYRGVTTIEGGTLCVTGTITNDNVIDVIAGATLHLDGGMLDTDTLNVEAGATVVARGTIAADVSNQGTLVVESGSLTIAGDVVNDGTLRVTGNAAFAASGLVVNHGILDLLTSASALPANLMSDGVVIANAERRITQIVRAGNALTLTIRGVAGHSYRLEHSAHLDSGWAPVGASQAGAGVPLVFTHATATAPRGYYRIAVTP